MVDITRNFQDTLQQSYNIINPNNSEIKLAFCVLSLAADSVPIKGDYLRNGQLHILPNEVISLSQAQSTNLKRVVPWVKQCTWKPSGRSFNSNRPNNFVPGKN